MTTARCPPASLVPSAYDPSVLLTTAGMQPFKPYFLGQEQPPHPRLTSCQKCFRTTDIDKVGSTARHLTFFEMLGNFSFGDYFKREAIDLAWELSIEAFGLDPERIWITVFEGDEELGLGPDEEAIELLARGRRAGGADRSPASLGELLAGRSGRPVRAVLRALPRPGPAFGARGELPGGESDRFLEFWNLVFMQYSLLEDGSLEPLPKQNIDTGAGPRPDRRRSSRTCRRCSRTTCSGRWSRLGETLSGRHYGAGPGDHAGASHPCGPHPRDDVPDRGRGRAVERGSRLHPASGDAQGDPAGSLDRPRAAFLGAFRRRRDRDHGG